MRFPPCPRIVALLREDSAFRQSELVDMARESKNQDITCLLIAILIAVLFARNHIVLPSWTFSSQHTLGASICFHFQQRKLSEILLPGEFTSVKLPCHSATRGHFACPPRSILFRVNTMEIDPDRATTHYAKLTLESACSVVDLLVAVQDVVTSKHLQGPISNGARLYLVLKKLFLEHQILHKHIEYNNISIRNDNGVQGVVIDLDFPDLIGASRSTEEFGLCGTVCLSRILLNFCAHTPKLARFPITQPTWKPFQLRQTTHHPGQLRVRVLCSLLGVLRIQPRWATR